MTELNGKNIREAVEYLKKNSINIQKDFFLANCPQCKIGHYFSDKTNEKCKRSLRKVLKIL